MGEKLRFSIIESFREWVPEDDIIAAPTPEIKAQGKKMLICGYCVLVEHPTLGRILFDTGVHNDWENTWNDTMKDLYNIVSFNDLRGELAKANLTAEDIDIVVVSHLHYDHAGNISMFQNTKAGKQIIISEAEAREAFVVTNLDDSGYYNAYWKPEFQNLEGIGYRLLTEDTKLADDVVLFIQRGHTPGVVGMMLHAESGTYIFTSDGIYSSRNYGPPIHLPGLCYDPVGYVESLKKVAAFKEQYNAQIIFSHDVEDIDAWKKIPYFYE